MAHLGRAEVVKDARLFAELTPAALAARCPGLSIGRRRAHLPVGLPTSSLAADVSGRGWGEVLPSTDVTTREAIREAIERLDEAGLPLGAVYVFDELWHLGAELAAIASEAFGAPYALLTDFWAFHVPPGRSGWPAHRGTTDLLTRDRPELLNVWVALSDVEADRSCMHLVPLDADAAYLAGHLEELPLDPAVLSPVRAGSALVWNANVAHWGGPCSPDALGPRTSVTFTLALGSEPSACLADTSGWTRIDALAEQLLVYASHATSEALDWARTTEMLRGAVTAKPAGR